jgi:hypothetical protein
MKTKIGIDPGASGGITSLTINGDLRVEKMPDTPLGILELLEDMTAQDSQISDLECGLERVGGYRPGNSGPAACKFARHCGHLDVAVLALEIPTRYIAPSVWMQHILQKTIHDKKERKNAIKAKMQERYPEVKVTLWSADALGIMSYLVDLEEKE